MALILVPPVGDPINGHVTPHDGCRAIGVVDGHTVRLDCRHRGIRTGRLLAFDAPELRADCASEFVRAPAAVPYRRWMLWRAGHVAATAAGTDRYGRALTLRMVDGQDVARPMVAAGLARCYDGGRRPGWFD